MYYMSVLKSVHQTSFILVFWDLIFFPAARSFMFHKVRTYKLFFSCKNKHNGELRFEKNDHVRLFFKLYNFCVRSFSKLAHILSPIKNQSELFSPHVYKSEGRGGHHTRLYIAPSWSSTWAQTCCKTYENEEWVQSILRLYNYDRGIFLNFVFGIDAHVQNRHILDSIPWIVGII